MKGGKKTPTPKISALPRKQPVLLRANFVLAGDRKRPYCGLSCGKIHREGSCSKAAGGPQQSPDAESCLGGGGLFPSSNRGRAGEEHDENTQTCRKDVHEKNFGSKKNRAGFSFPMTGLEALLQQYFGGAFCAPQVRLKWHGFKKGISSDSSHCSGGLFPQHFGGSPSKHLPLLKQTILEESSSRKCISYKQFLTNILLSLCLLSLMLQFLEIANYNSQGVIFVLFRLVEILGLVVKRCDL